MIWYIRGTFLEIVGSEVLIQPDGGGVGYLVTVWGDLLGHQAWSDMQMYVYHHITEQSQKLFWFSSLSQRDVFMTLLSVNGLGPKWAISLLGLGETNLVTAISSADEWQLTSAVGVGPKLAKKIILELSGKLQLNDSDDDGPSVKPTADNQEITDTLASMWYEKRKVEQILSKIPADITTIEEKTLYCIRQLSHS